MTESRTRTPEEGRTSGRGRAATPQAGEGQRVSKAPERPRTSREIETRTRRDIETRQRRDLESPRRAHESSMSEARVQDSPWVRVGPRSAPIDTVTHRMNERLAERKRTERRRAWSKFGRWAAIAGVIAGALWAFFMSPLFTLHTPNVELLGLSDEIDDTAVATVIGSHDGESLALLNVPHVADQLREITGVLDAKVERVWPSGLRVTLVARRPVAAIASGAGFTLLDADSIEVGFVDQAPTSLPLVTVPVGDDRVLSAVLEVIRNLPAGVLGRVSGIGAQTEDTVSFALTDGPRVEWGSADDSALKAQVLAAMLASSSAPVGGVIDVSAPTLPITRAAG